MNKKLENHPQMKSAQGKETIWDWIQLCVKEIDLFTVFCTLEALSGNWQLRWLGFHEFLMTVNCLSGSVSQWGKAGFAEVEKSLGLSSGACICVRLSYLPSTFFVLMTITFRRE